MSTLGNAFIAHGITAAEVGDANEFKLRRKTPVLKCTWGFFMPEMFKTQRDYKKDSKTFGV